MTTRNPAATDTPIRRRGPREDIRTGNTVSSIAAALVDNVHFLQAKAPEDYRECQRRVGAAYRDPDGWTRKSILNAARVGRFSDRAVRQYCRDIWGIGALAEGER
jgi:starch phosphorylase